MKKALKLEISGEVAILFLEDHSLHFFLKTSIALMDFISLLNTYLQQGYTFVDYSHLKEIDLSGLSVIEQDHIIKMNSCKGRIK